MALPQSQRFARIVRNPRILGGEPTIKGTRVSVRIMVLNGRLYHDVEELLNGFPHLDAADIEEALAFYEQHRSEIDRYISLNKDDSDQCHARRCCWTSASTLGWQTACAEEASSSSHRQRRERPVSTRERSLPTRRGVAG